MHRTHKFKLSCTGFTLIEVLISMSVFIIVLVIAGNAFNTIVSQSTRLSKMEESNIEGIVGLEIMRHDLEQMGFGLPWGWGKPDPPAVGSTVPNTLLIDAVDIDYKEAVDLKGLKLNDSPSSVPRAFAAQALLGAFSSAHIAVKGSALGSSKVSQRWTRIPFHNMTASVPVPSPVSPLKGDKVIMVTNNFNNANLDHRLIVDPADKSIFHQNFDTVNMSDNFLPVNDQFSYMVYGIDGETAPRMPFNRADFFIKIPAGTEAEGKLPPFCAPRTGILYKATVSHKDGSYRYIPLLDCVADMQVVLGWDTSDKGSAGAVNVHSSLPDSAGELIVSDTKYESTIKGYFSDTTAAAEHIRQHLKVVKVYILAQTGKKDPGYRAPEVSIEVGNHLLDGLYPERKYFLSASQQNYRWKLYRIVARPKNLSSNFN